MNDALGRSGDAKLAGILLVATPAFAIVAAVAWLLGGPGTDAAPLVVLQVRWTLVWACVLAAAATFAVGAYLAVGVLDGGPREALLGMLAVLVLPMGLLAAGLATFASRALVRRDAMYAVATEELPLVLDVLAATTNAVVLATAVLVGVVLAGLGTMLEGRKDCPELLGPAGQVLGALAAAVNLALLIVGEATSLFLLGVGSLLLASFWLVPAGWLLVRDVSADPNRL